MLIVNPASRRGEWLLEEALATFKSAGVAVDFFQTEQVGHGGEIASELAEKYDATFALGGDGTADEVIGALAGRDIPVGVLPGGTGNLLARTLGTPLSMREAIPALLGGRDFRCDTGLTDRNHNFIFSLGIGIDARMMAETGAEFKRVLGVLAYAFSAARVTLLREPFTVRVNVDGEWIERGASMVVVANFGSVLSDLLHFGPDIRSDDGLLNLCIYSPASFEDAVRMIWRMSNKQFDGDPGMLFRSGRRIRIEAEPPCVVQADGELLHQTPVEVEVHPRAARLLVPSWFRQRTTPAAAVHESPATQ